MNDDIGREGTGSGYPARQKKDGLYDENHDENRDFSMPDLTGAFGAAKRSQASRTALPSGKMQASNIPLPPKASPEKSGFQPVSSGNDTVKPPYPSGLAAGLQATADATGAEYDPDNQLSSRLFQAGRHDAVAASLSDEYDPANSPSVRAMQAGRHEVPEKTIDLQYHLDRQPSSALLRQMRGNGTRVSGMQTVANTRDEMYRMHQWNPEKGPDYAQPFVTSLRQSSLSSMTPNHEAAIFERASDRPDQFTETAPLDKAQSDARYLEDWEKRIGERDQKEGKAFSYPEKTAQQIHELKEKMSALSGSVVEPALMIAVSRKLPGSTIYWAAHEWNRLAGLIHRQVLDKTGNDLLAESIAAGALAAMTEYFVPKGFLPGRYAPDFGEIAATVSSVLDGLLAGYVGKKVAKWEEEWLIKQNYPESDQNQNY